MAEILVVEDERTYRFALAEFLGMRGDVVVCVESVPAARAELRRRRFDAVVVDLCLGDPHVANGLEVLREARALMPGAARIALSAHRITNWSGAAAEAGAQLVLTKGQPLGELEEHVHRLVTEAAGR